MGTSCLTWLATVQTFPCSWMEGCVLVSWETPAATTYLYVVNPPLNPCYLAHWKKNVDQFWLWPLQESARITQCLLHSLCAVPLQCCCGSSGLVVRAPEHLHIIIMKCRIESDGHCYCEVVKPHRHGYWKKRLCALQTAQCCLVTFRGWKRQ